LGMRFTAYIGFEFEANSDQEAQEYAHLLNRSLDWPSRDPRFEERAVQATFVDRVELREPS
jgi:hypothetical protein